MSATDSAHKDEDIVHDTSEEPLAESGCDNEYEEESSSSDSEGDGEAGCFPKYHRR